MGNIAAPPCRTERLAEPCRANAAWDALREANVIADRDEHPREDNLQDYELPRRQPGAGPARLADRLARSRDGVGGGTRPEVRAIFRGALGSSASRSLAWIEIYRLRQ